MKLFYRKINQFILNHPLIQSSLHFLSRFVPAITFIFYALFVLKIYLESFNNFYSTLFKPLITVLIVLIIKLLINRQRPNKKYNLTPIEQSLKTNHSFPSIHVAFAVSVALTVLHRGPNMGALLSALAIITTLVRSVTGVHYLSDIGCSVLIAYLVDIFL